MSLNIHFLRGFRIILICLLIPIVLTSCTPMDNQEARMDYREMKQIVLDVLHTEEGKKAIEETLNRDQITSQQLFRDPQAIKMLEKVMLSPENKEKIQLMMADPEFMKDYAKQFEEEHKRLIKDLMKDPEYRKSLVEVLRDPEMEKQFLEMQTNVAFREHLMNVMKESIQSPYLRYEIMEILTQIAADPTKIQQQQQQQQQQDDQEKQGGSGQEGEGGGQGGGQGGGSGG